MMEWKVQQVQVQVRMAERRCVRGCVCACFAVMRGGMCVHVLHMLHMLHVLLRARSASCTSSGFRLSSS